ncbi:MAG: HigA family addiction module antitoxin [Tepidisphaeraceae bacterium]|jgi:HTH-type transcriptional regulator/antitoxin HigA
MKTHETIVPAVVLPPGDTIREELQARGWSQRVFASRIGRPVQAVNEIIRGRRRITAETALALGEVFGTSAELWMGLEGRYRLHLARQNRRRRMPA